MSDSVEPLTTQDPWQQLKMFTSARIALGRTGMSLTTQTHLEFQLAHALARDAVKSSVDFTVLEHSLNSKGFSTMILQSQVDNQMMYLQRPDLGRLLNATAMTRLRESEVNAADAVVVVVDGLSSKAIELHAEPVLNLLLPELQASNLNIPPILLVRFGRVAIGDVIADHFSAKFCIVLIGERPGLSSPDSLGVYFTYQAKPGISTDANRNCISNIHGNGLAYPSAVKKLLYLIKASEKLQYSGVNLKDETGSVEGEYFQTSTNFLLE